MQYNKILVNQLYVENKVVFLRLDLNVPVMNGKITSFKRIDATIPTIEYLLEKNAKVVILSHMGRVKKLEDVTSGKLSLEIVARELAKKLYGKANQVSFIGANKGKVVEESISEMKSRDVIVLENTRFNDIDLEGNKINLESGNDEELAKYWAGLCDAFVNDAFGAAHRQHASTFGIGKFQKNNAIGFLMQKELETLSEVTDEPKKPFVVLFGGAKVSDKLKAVRSVIEKADKVIISGGMAYTFAAAKGFDVGLSLVEKDMIPTAQELMAEYADKLSISCDFECSPQFENIEPTYRTQEEGMKGLMGLDIGPKSIELFKNDIATAQTVLWNGPMGVTEFSYYEKGTNEICNAIAERTEQGAFTVIGGGDSAAAAEKLGKQDSFSFISTGGGASLTLIEGSDLMGIASINDR
ncbi:phosphoglycerate kinase [Ureaplasma ceti]|uniref:Phosphoglycerate kinase n=1 Tax=Ureaplasma ceti TaxID=3119530 RepID=A0ABP9U9I2_9BACT